MKAGAALTALLLLGAGCANHAKHGPAASAPGWRITLSSRPATPRQMDPAQFQVRLTDRRGRPVDGAQVVLQLIMPAMDMGRSEIPAEAQSAGAYKATGRFSMPGDWQVTVQADKGTAHQSQSFPITVN